MKPQQTPIEIARQALKTLAQSKIPPTPDNFRKVYDEIIGAESAKSEDPLQLLARLLKEAGRGRPKYARLAAQLQQAAAQSNGPELETLLRQLLPAAMRPTGGTCCAS
ncbi:MAG TPA: hypothetical protein VGK14_04855 [Novimethylophilus sp.]|jgi:diguanylate cyclase|uniref:hypothetical protein n=1 Tax=Novimethylophilus sp. TaxID=2137426 RepID=UPI002F4173DE